MIQPTYSEFEQLCRQGSLIPMFTVIPGDLDTPVSAFMKIDDSRSSFLLESVEGGEKWARYSFLGSEPRLIIKIKDHAAEIAAEGQTKTIDSGGSPTSLIKQVMSQFQPVPLPGLPEFFGGAVGFFSYDIVRNFEKLPDLSNPDLGFHDALFMVTRDVVVFDNFTNQIILVANICPSEHSSTQNAYSEGRLRLERMRFLLNLSASGTSGKNFTSRQQPFFEPNMSQGNFQAMVAKAKQHIRAGDIIQVVLSQRFSGELTCDPLNVYRSLRLINPSPYMFFVRVDDEILAGSSPEAMVRMRNGEAIVRPIAGTRRRGRSLPEDEALVAELLSDPKEIAEHVMLVDLARNDLGRIAQPGTVVVDEFKVVEKYSHVMHIVSNVKAKPAAHIDAYEILKATFPAGTLTGAPKIRAMEIIEELEPERRGPYGGCVGYFSYTGSMDMGITIRTVMVKGSRVYFQAGAGIVADSVPELEYQETMKKAAVMRKAIEMAHEFNRRLK